MSNTIYSHVEYGYLEKASFKNCQNNECILLFENKIYDKHQVKHVQTLNYYNNVKLLYQFFIQLLKFNLQFNFISNLLIMLLVKTNLLYLLSFNFLLYIIGLLGIFCNRKNFLLILIAIEIFILAINLNFIIFSIYLDDIYGQIYVLFILTVAATESALGLAFIMNYYQISNQIYVDYLKSLKN